MLMVLVLMFYSLHCVTLVMGIPNTLAKKEVLDTEQITAYLRVATEHPPKNSISALLRVVIILKMLLRNLVLKVILL